MNPQEVRALTHRLRRMEDPDLTAFGEKYKTNPIVFPLVFIESMFREGLDREKAMQQGDAQPVNEQALKSMHARATPLPEEVGIGALPAGNMEYAEGGIVAFAGGSKVESDPVQDFATQYKSLAERVGAELDVDPGLILAQWGHETGWGRGVPGKYNLGNIKGKGTTAYDTIEKSKSQYKNYASPDEFAADYVDQIKRNWPGAMGAKRDVGAFTAGLEQGRLGKYATDESYGKKLASAVTKALPFSAAQAANTTHQAAPKDAPSVYTGPGYTTDGLEALGQRLDVIREARSKAKPPTLRERQADPEAAKRYQALQDLNLGAQREYEKYAENIYNKPAFAAPSAGGKGVGTTTLPAAQAVAKEVAAPDIAAQEDRRAGTEVALPESGEYRGKSGDPDEDIGPAQPALSPKQEKQVIAAAKEAVPEGTNTKGWTSEDWLTLGFSLLSSDSPYFTKALGTAGAAVQTGRQAREKTGLEALKTRQDIESSKALARKYGAEALRYEAEDKPLAQMRKEIAAAYLKLESDAMLKLDPAKLAAEKRRVAAEIMANYPELADTMGAGAAPGVAVPQGVKVTRIGQ